jgi:putative spermidine/putrescine transport system substrate-binding protein
MRLQVESGNVKWDLVDLTGAQFQQASTQNLLEPYNYDVIDTKYLPEFIEAGKFGFVYSSYLFLTAWDEREVSRAQAPRSWSEFWDTDRLPGRRSLYDNLTDGSILEAALVADGVPLSADEIYPLDVDRALASLDRLGDDVIWHSSNEQPIQQLRTGETPLATSWIARVTAAKAEGAPIAWTPNEGFVTGSILAIPKGAPHADAAQKFLNFMFTEARPAAEFTKLTWSPISNTAALEHLPNEMLSQLPTSPELAESVVVKDDAWWADNVDEVSEQFKQWQLG